MSPSCAIVLAFNSGLHTCGRAQKGDGHVRVAKNRIRNSIVTKNANAHWPLFSSSFQSFDTSAFHENAALDCICRALHSRPAAAQRLSGYIYKTVLLCLVPTMTISMEAIRSYIYPARRYIHEKTKDGEKAATKRMARIRKTGCGVWAA